MNLKEIVKAKRNTLQVYATLQKYEMYKRTTAIIPRLYEDDNLFYNDSVQQRHERNKKQIRKVIQAIRSGKMVPEMLQYNTTNAFYPSYVLNHHYSHFVKLTAELSGSNQGLRKLMPKLKDFTIVGAVFQRMLNVKFTKENKVWLENGIIRMSPNSYFYSFKTSPYIHLCCFQIKEGNKNIYVYAQLRDDKSQFCPGIEVRDLGATISPDYLTIAYRLDNVKPLFVIETSSGKVYRNIVSNDAAVEFGYSLQDLANSLYVTVKYTNMRLQFSTLEKSKAERPIGQYQAVTSRIADGFATLFGLSLFRQRLLNMQEFGNFMRFYIPFMHQVVLQRLIDLRECCGGYGYLQMSGHPGFLQRVSIRSAEPAVTTIPDNKAIMKRLHYYSNEQCQKDYQSQISAEGNTNNDIFNYFIIICINMRKQRQSISPRQYIKQFLRQSCIQIIYNATYFDIPDPSNQTEDLLQFIIVKYVLDHSKYLSDSFVKVNREQFHALMTSKKTELLNKIKDKIPQLTDILEIGYLRNIIVGDEKNPKPFYEKVMAASENNRRNSQQYKKTVLSELITVIKQQRASL